jgi:hypothetical protein
MLTVIAAVLVISLALPAHSERIPRSLELTDPTDPDYYVSGPSTFIGLFVVQVMKH